MGVERYSLSSRNVRPTYFLFIYKIYACNVCTFVLESPVSDARRDLIDDGVRVKTFM